MLTRKSKLVLTKIFSFFSVIRGYNIWVVALAQYLHPFIQLHSLKIYSKTHQDLHVTYPTHLMPPLHFFAPSCYRAYDSHVIMKTFAPLYILSIFTMITILHPLMMQRLFQLVNIIHPLWNFDCNISLKLPVQYFRYI